MADAVTTDFNPVSKIVTDFKPTGKAFPDKPEPPPFPFDPWVNELFKEHSPEQKAEKSEGLAKTFHAIVSPWMSAGYEAGSSINRGIAHFTDSLDVMSRWFEANGFGKREGFFEQMTKTYNDNADYWKDRAEKVGVNFLTEMAGTAFALPSNALVGMTDFSLKVASGFSIPAIVGYQEAKEHDTDPFIGGLVEAAKTKTLDSMFRLVAPFNRYIQSLVMGTTFGVEDAIQAPKGEGAKAFIKGAATGVGMAMTAPSGNWGIRDVYPEIGRTVPEIRKEIETFERIKEPAVARETLEQTPSLADYVIKRPEIHDEQTIARARELKAMPTGPGAATAGVSELAPDIAQLGQAVQSLSPESSLKERIDVGAKATQVYTGVLAGAKNAVEKVKAMGVASWDWYTRQPKWTNFDDMLGKYLGGRQIRGKTLEDEFIKPIQKALSKDKQIAIECYAKAGGDRATLQEWVDGSTKPELKIGYQDALTLTPDEITIAENVKQYYSAKLDEAIKAGVLDHGIENYVNQMWEKPDNETALRLKSEINAGMLRTNPAFARKRIFESDFEGEQKGFKPKDKSIGFRIAAYEQAMGEAIDARAFIKSLLDGDGKDGRPLVVVRGGGKAVPEGEAAEAYLIRPRSTPEEAYDYREINHPSLRKWKWATKDAEGNPIFVQGDLIVHPEIYNHLKNVLSKSAIRESAVGRAALRGSMELKSTLLSLSSFHQVQIGVHGVFHWENIFNAPNIDFNQPIQKDLVQHGLMVYNHNALSEFSEGLSTAGLTNRIPGIGPYLQKYSGYLFQDLIPRLKMKLAIDMVERNTPRYPNLSRDQILKLSSDQANAAFGELNYKQMGRNPTMQDVFRLGALAPDFLEARARFVGEAIRPYGKEQAIALVRGATMMYAAKVLIEGIANLVDPDKNEIHWDRPFSVTIDGKEYALRSIPGDIYHLVRDPRGFIYHRLNPSIVRPMIEFVTGRDMFGKRRDIAEQAKDYVTGFVPIPGQGLFTQQDRTLYDSILQSMGVSSWKYRTDAERVVREIQGEKARAEAIGETRERFRLKKKLGDDYAKTLDFEPIKKAIEEGKITPKDVSGITQKAIKGDVERGVKGFNFPESLKVWKSASNEEKATIQPMILQKWFSWDATTDERKRFQKDIEEIMSWKPKGEIKRKRFSIRQE